MNKVQKERELQNLQSLKELAVSEFWPVLVSKINEYYRTADSIFHSKNLANREYYAGQCQGYEDIIGMKENIDGKIEDLEVELKLKEGE